MLEHGLDAVAPAVLEAFEGQVEEALHAPGDFKTRLQEEAAKRGWKVTYSVVEVEGPAHDRLFTCAALVAGVPRGLGTGRSKKGGAAGRCRRGPRVPLGRVRRDSH